MLDRSSVNQTTSSSLRGGDRNAGGGLVVFVGGGFLAASLMVAHTLSLILATVGASLIAASVVHAFRGVWQRVRRARTITRLGQLVQDDAAPTFITDGDGSVLFTNHAACRRFPDEAPNEAGGRLGVVLQDVFANPAPVLRRMQATAERENQMVEDVVTHRGQLRISVHHAEVDRFLWRLDEIGTGPGRDRSGTGIPMITVGRGNAILFMNDAARSYCGRRHRTLDSLFPELPLRSGGFNLVLGEAGRTNCLIHEVTRTPGRREVYFVPLQSGAAPQSGDLDALPVALLKLGPQGEILQSNRAAERLLQAEGQNCTMLADFLDGPGRPLETWIQEAFVSEQNIQPEFLAVKQGGGDRFVQISLNRIEEPDGSRLIGVLNDATEWKQLEAQFVQSQKMQAIGELAGGIAHDFNNLLTAISGHCDLLLQGRGHDDPDYADLTQISQNANRAASLVGQLLAFSRKQTLRPEPLDIAEALGDLAHLLNRLVGEAIDLRLRHAEGAKVIRADKRQLEQVLMNLVVNARDAMSGSGAIEIVTEPVELDRAMARDRVEVPAGRYISIAVNDNGVGIAPNVITKVFEPFFTTKGVGKGTGLGLSTAYGIVKQSGGFIFVDSERGTGTTFTLLFPTYDGPVEPAKPLPRKVEAAVTGKRVVLLVEDEAPVRAFAARALRLSGLSVLEAPNAEAALEILENEDLEVDLFLSDVVMPGKDGPTWVREARHRRPNAKVIFVSGYAENALNHRSSDLDEAEFLPKPFSLNQLIETVQAQLGEERPN